MKTMFEWLKCAQRTNTTEHGDLEGRLKLASERLSITMTTLSPKEFEAAHEDVLVLERKLAAAKGEQYAEPLDFPIKWDIGAPLPQLLVNDYRALLTFVISEPDPAWDGSYVTVMNPASGQAWPLGLVVFEGCMSAKLGAPNDEVFEGHPLNGKGMKAYSAQRVVNSIWLKELETINSIHRCYNPALWRDLNHYVFWFHDSTFECIAKSFKVEIYRESMESLLIRMVEGLVS